MRILILIVIVLAKTFNVNAQTVACITGEKIHPDDPGNIYFLSGDSTALFVLREVNTGQKNTYFLEAFSKDSLHRLSRVSIPFPSENDTQYHLCKIIVHHAYCQAFYTWFDKESKKEKLEMVNFDFEGKKTGTSKTINNSDGKNESATGDFYLYNIPAKNELLCYNEKILKGERIISIDHYNYEGEKIKSITFNNVTLRHVVLQRFDNDGRMLFVTRDEDNVFFQDWRLKIYSPDADTAARILLQKPDDQGYWLSDFFTSYNDTAGNLYLITSYSRRKHNKSADGIYLVKLKLNENKVLSEVFIPFKISADDPNHSRKANKLSNCIIAGIFPLPGGQLCVLFESRLREQMFSSGPSGLDQFTIGDILSMVIDSNNNEVSLCRIKKQQRLYLNKSTYTGFVYLHRGNKCYFVFNDLPENLQKAKDEDLEKVKNSNADETVIVAVTTEINRITSRNILIERKDRSLMDALQIESSAYLDDELYTLRQIGNENFLTKIFLTDK